MTEDEWDEYPNDEPIEFRLATGTRVKVVFASYWTRSHPMDFIQGHFPSHFYGVRIYSNEGSFSERLLLHVELRTPHDFSTEAVPLARIWLEETARSRRIMDYETLNEFVEDFAQILARDSHAALDAADYYEKGRLEVQVDPDHLSDLLPPSDQDAQL